MSPHPSLYLGDINYQHVNWGYNTTSPDSESLDSWAASNNLGRLYNPKETASFFSHHWNVGTNPDLSFTSLGQDSRLPGIPFTSLGQDSRLPGIRVLGNFPTAKALHNIDPPS